MNEVYFHLYLHHTPSGPESNQIETVNRNLHNSFGSIVVKDWPLYDEFGPHAKLIARAQGLHIQAGTKTQNWYNSFSILFEDTRFKGSTLQVMGPSIEKGQWAIVGGTGDLAMARGIIYKKNPEKIGRSVVIELDIHAFCKPQNLTWKGAGKMFAARSLDIIHSSNTAYWIWVRPNDSRFTEVAKLLRVWWLDIKARIKLNELLPKTKYTARLIFKTLPDSRGLNTFQEASVSMGTFKQKKNVCISPRVVEPNVVLPVSRSDGWMELELGQFDCDDNITGDREVVVGLMETDDYNMKTGLIVGGLEVRPINYYLRAVI